MDSSSVNSSCPRLIEVALPIREISAESVRDKSLRHGHISTLHLWWARRPLAASRAVVFASLVPDPDDPRCPADFRVAVERHLKTHVPTELKHYRRGRESRRDEDPYRPYEGMPDTLRNRLLMFIAKWSPESLAFEAGKAKKEPDPKYLLDDRSLVKWETSDPENPQGRVILKVARHLIWTAHGLTIDDWRLPNSEQSEIENHQSAIPVVLDPFAGGGAIPLEAGRLGCRAIANDYNPVAYLILRATCEFPQKYGKTGKRKLVVEEFGKQVAREIEVPNVLAHDVERWARWILERARKRIGQLYPPGKDLPAPRRGKFYIYVLKCSDDSFYIGQTEDIPRRLSEHKSGKVSWTSKHLPVEIIHWEEFYSREAAVKREHNLKTGFGRTWLKREFEAGRLAARQAGGRPVVGYLWARTAPCSNPSCRGEIPLLRSLLVCNKSDKKVALTMEADKERKTVRFGIAKGKAIQRTEGTKRERGPAICPFCEHPTSEADLRRAGQMGQMGERMVAVIEEKEESRTRYIDGRYVTVKIKTKDYRPVEETDLAAFRQAATIEVERPGELILPEVNADDADDDVSNSTGVRVHLYGMTTWGSLFNPRQLVAMQTFVACLREALERMREDLPAAPACAQQADRPSGSAAQAGIADEEYWKALGVYLGLWLSRIAQRGSNVGLWNTQGEKLEHPFGRQAIPMTWDYPEANPFGDVSGGAEGQIGWMLRVISRESCPTIPGKVSLGDAAHLAMGNGSTDLVVTDPPYFDAIAYGDLSDYFYVWLKRGLGNLVSEALVTPLTPKGDEATALKHRHEGDGDRADGHFRRKLAQALSEAHRTVKPGGVVSIMFAHQSTKAWTALISAIFDANLTVDATWPIDTERTFALKASMSALASSITVICRPRVVGSAASYKQVRREIEQVVQESVKRFWSYGFRGADLIVACYGPAVGVFGKYERVEKADGTPVGIPELLELAKQAARDAIAGEFRGDNLSTLYYVWANLYGAAEQAWDDARLVVQIGGDEDNAMEVARGHGIFVVNGATCRLAMLADRADKRNLGLDQSPPLIDALHRTMLLWKQEKRSELINYLGERGLLDDGPFWKLAQALFEVLPRDLEDWKLVNALLGERQTLRTEGKRTAYRDAQKALFD